MKYCLLAFVLWIFSNQLPAQNISIIPAPEKVEVLKGKFSLTTSTVLIANNAIDNNTAQFFNQYLYKYYGFKLKVVNSAKSNYISFTTPTFIQKPDNEERYTLNVSSSTIQIQGDGIAGTFYGMQSLIQLLPFSPKKTFSFLNIPCVSIEDKPRFKYRGMHLDVSRHFFSVDYVKQYIDFLALHKMNYFHWHLTDDQGWRIEIKKYPKLTSIGSKRNGTIVGRYPGKGNDAREHKGFYTQEEVKEVVKYAAERNITVVPEIEMPGHASAAIAAYPELSCFPNESTKHPTACAWNGDTTGKHVQQTWGVFEDVFCPSEYTFNFLENVLNEVIQLFPSNYIHIGGDECPKESWKRSVFCQQLIKEKGLKDEHELQSYFIQRIEEYLNSKGKQIIGWDEILEGGLAPNATVMSWRGEKGGIEAAKQKHNVIMTPGGWCYFDHTQTKNEDSVTIGGYTSLEKVYSYEPISSELSNEEAKYILGAQANLWTEYIAYPSKIEYMIFPRMSALSEVLWSKKESRNWDDFEKRLSTQFERYNLWKVNYSKAYYDIQPLFSKAKNERGIEVQLTSNKKNESIYYNLDKKSSSFSLYKNEFTISESTQLLFKSKSGNLQQVDFKFNKATGKSIIVNPLPTGSYMGDGAFTLVNGIQNTRGRMRDAEFIGYSGKDVEVIINLGKNENISSVALHAFESRASWIYAPAKMEVYTSIDGKDFQLLGSSTAFINNRDGNGILQINSNANVQWVKLIIKNYGKIASGNNGAGNNAWMFLDEIEIN